MGLGTCPGGILNSHWARTPRCQTPPSPPNVPVSTRQALSCMDQKGAATQPSWPWLPFALILSQLGEGRGNTGFASAGMLWQQLWWHGGGRSVEERLKPELCFATSCRVPVSLSQRYHDTQPLGGLHLWSLPGRSTGPPVSRLLFPSACSDRLCPIFQSLPSQCGSRAPLLLVLKIKHGVFGSHNHISIRFDAEDGWDQSPTPVSSRRKQWVSAACTMDRCKHHGS